MDIISHKNLFFITETLRSADGDVAVYLGKSAYPHTDGKLYTHCNDVITTITSDLVTKTVVCIVPIATVYIYIVGNSGAPLSLCDVTVKSAGQSEFVISRNIAKQIFPIPSRNFLRMEMRVRWIKIVDLNQFFSMRVCKNWHLIRILLIPYTAMLLPMYSLQHIC